MTLSQRVRYAREDKGYGQEYMADRLCVSQSTYCRIERNDARCKKLLNRLAAVLDVAPDALYPTATDNPVSDQPDSELRARLSRQQTIIDQYNEEITSLKAQLQAMLTVWQQFFGGGVNSLIYRYIWNLF